MSKKKFSVQFEIYASTSVTVEADNEEQAREIATKNAYAPCLCHQCADDLDIGDIGEITEVLELGESNQSAAPQWSDK